MKHWKESLQEELDANNLLRQGSIYRAGDSVSETPGCEEGAGRARNLFAEISEGFAALATIGVE